MNNDNNVFELALAKSITLPGVKINREKFLQKEFRKICTPEQLEKVIKYNPTAAGVSEDSITKIANSCIKYETRKVTGISVAAGLPGGAAMIATIPADMVQYVGHMLRIVQKLVFLYGWEDLIDDFNEIDDETKNMLILLIGVMFGVSQASAAIGKIAKGAAGVAAKKIAQKSLTKTVYYPIVKKVAAALGAKMTKDIFAKGVSKAIPIIGGVVSGGVSYATFKPMSHKLKKYLSNLDKPVETVSDDNDMDSIVDADYKDVNSCQNI